MEISKKIADHFAGVVHIDISHKEQIEHNQLVRQVRKSTQYMLKKESLKLLALGFDL